MRKDTLNYQLIAGRIKRWHTYPTIGEQTVGEHTYGVLQILRYIMEEEWDIDMVHAVLDHDVPEVVLGDIPYSGKKLVPAIRAAEQRVANEVGLSTDAPCSEAIKIADLLEMGIWGAQQVSMGNSNGHQIVNTVCKEVEQIEKYEAYPRAHELVAELKSIARGANDESGE